jgi:hypothetical protein
MGLVARNPGDAVRLGFSATAASAVLYSAVVLLGLGAASPSAQGREAGRDPSVVRVPRDPAVRGPAQRLPQVSPGPARHHSQPRRPAVQEAVGATSTSVAQPRGEEGSPEPPRAPKPDTKPTSQPADDAQTSAPVPTAPTEPDPVVTVPELTVTVPELPALPPPLPPLPPLPTAPVPALLLP